jgi:FixJ family two-component response regulator
MSNKVDVALVVEDAAVRNALTFALEVEGLSVRLDDRSTVAAADAELLRCGCLVIGHRMPRLDGLELIEILRARDVCVPAIVIAGCANRQLRDRAATAGVRHFLEIPLCGEDLLDAIRATLGTAQ